MWTRWRDAAADLAFGAACPGCGRPGWGLCAGCAAELAPVGVWVDLPGGGVAVAAGPYAGVARASLVAYKERGAWHLSRPLGAVLAWSVAALYGAAGVSGPVELVPIPSAGRRVRERGEDVTRRLARAAASALRGAGLPATVAPRLHLARAVADQAGLSRSQRTTNLTRSMSASGSGSVPWVVVDDIVTTGATLAEGVRALGPGGLGAAVVAATPLLGRPAGGAR